jgi:Zn-dependent protease with chaperone function
VTYAVLFLPALIAASFGIVGPQAARRLPPWQATWLLSAGGAVAALSGIALLGLLGFVVVGEQPAIAQEGHWSASALRDHAPVGGAVASAALMAVVIAGVAGLVVAARRGRAVLAAYRSCHDLPAGGGELVVVPDASGGAYALPGRPGRIVVSQPLLAELSARQRRALLAHERAHLEHGHHWHLAVVTVTTAINPLLLPLRSAAEQTVERWADEEAAAEVGDRRVVASALAAAALFLGPRPSAALAVATRAIPVRVAALLASPPQRRPIPMVLMLLLLLAGVASVLIAGKEVEHLFEFAMRAERARRAG